MTVLLLGVAGAGAATVPTQGLGFEVRLEQFQVWRPDEEAGGDEPYLWVLFFQVDGSTLHPGRPSEVSAAFSSPHGRHGIGSHRNLGGRSLRRGASVSVPDRLGLHTGRLVRIGELPEDITRFATLAGVIVVALEEDDSPESAVEAGRREFERAITDEVNASVRGSRTFVDFGQMGRPIRDRVVRGVMDRTLRGWRRVFRFLTAGRDPDDLVGVDVGIARYGELFVRGRVGPFTMSFGNRGVRYLVTWARATAVEETAVEDLMLAAALARAGAKWWTASR